MMRFKIKKKTLLDIVTLFIYKVFLDLSYYFVISRVWDYFGFPLRFNGIKFVESYILLFTIFLFMPRSTKKLSEVISWLLIVLSYIPLLTVYAFKDEARIYMYGVTGFWVLVFLLLRIIPNINIIAIKKSQSKLLYYFMFIFLSLTGIFLIAKYSSFSFNFDLSKVYDIRSSYVSAEIPFSGYLFNWLSLIVNPLFFVMFIKKRNWFFAAIVVLIQFILFSITGNRIYLFTLPYILFFFWMLKSNYLSTIVYSSIASIIILGIASYLFFGDIWISGLFTFRTLLDPAVLSFEYYDFFSHNEFLFLSSTSIFNHFISYPYQLDPPHLIGELYYQNPFSNANNGIYADAYMNFGFLGFLIWAFLLTILLKTMDWLSKDKDLKICFAVIGIAPLVLTNAPFFTSLVTNGLFVGFVFLYLLPREVGNIRQKIN